jgi:hypothetical protein
MELPILAGEDNGYRLDILLRTHQLFADMLNHHYSVFFVRFDLHFPQYRQYTLDNRLIQNFTDRLVDYFDKLRVEHAFLWVREQKWDDYQQHYHLFFLLNGSRMQSAYGLLSKANQLWADILCVADGHGLVHLCEWSESNLSRNGGVMIRRNSVDYEAAYRLCFKRASYLSKTTTKGHAPPNVREFSSSHLA